MLKDTMDAAVKSGGLWTLAIAGVTTWVFMWIAIVHFIVKYW